MSSTPLVRAILILPLVAAVARAQHVGPGEPSPEIEFRSILRGDGRTRLSEYRGQPVVLALFSNVFGGTEAARGALDLLAEHGAGGLVVLLMEDEKEHDETYVEALALKELPGSTCPLLRRQFLPYRWEQETGPPPVLALVGIDGTVLYAGSYQGLRNVDKAIEAELERAEEGWGDDAVAREVRALAFGAKQLGAARRRLDEVAASAEPSAQVGAAAAEVDGRFASWKRSVVHFAETGRPTRALESARALVGAVAGHAAWSAEARALLAPLETPEAEAVRTLEEKLAKLLRPLESKAPRKGLPDKLRRFADDVGEPSLATRARRIAAAAEHALESL